MSPCHWQIAICIPITYNYNINMYNHTCRSEWCQHWSYNPNTSPAAGNNAINRTFTHDWLHGKYLNVYKLHKSGKQINYITKLAHSSVSISVCLCLTYIIAWHPSCLIFICCCIILRVWYRAWWPRAAIVWLVAAGIALSMVSVCAETLI